MDRNSAYSTSTALTLTPTNFAGAPAGNFTGAALFEVVSGGAATLVTRDPGTNIAAISGANNLGGTEINMGDGAILQGFLIWGLAQATINGS
jgi:hypothetical protein